MRPLRRGVMVVLGLNLLLGLLAVVLPADDDPLADDQDWRGAGAPTKHGERRTSLLRPS